MYVTVCTYVYYEAVHVRTYTVRYREDKDVLFDVTKLEKVLIREVPLQHILGIDATKLHMCTYTYTRCIRSSFLRQRYICILRGWIKGTACSVLIIQYSVRTRSLEF